MRSFKQILWRHVWRYGFAQFVLWVTGTVLIDRHYDHAFPSQRRIVLLCVWFFCLVLVMTVWNAWDEWRRASRATIE
jgi:hypothetical protein